MQSQRPGALAPGREKSLSLDPRTERQLPGSLRLIARKTHRQIKLDLPIMSCLVLDRLMREHGIDHSYARRRVTQGLTASDGRPQGHDKMLFRSQDTRATLRRPEPCQPAGLTQAGGLTRQTACEPPRAESASTSATARCARASLQWSDAEALRR